jgi:Cdc6-like AAA superfamily ATPase
LIKSITDDYKSIKPSNSICEGKKFIPRVKTRFHNINQTFDKYDPDELEKILKESQKGKFN